MSLSAVQKAAAVLGRIGGSAKGKNKRRGDSKYYRALRKKRKAP